MGDPFEVLGLPPDADVRAVRAARRALAKQLHPDAGGDPAAMGRINSAHDAAMADLAERAAEIPARSAMDPADAGPSGATPAGATPAGATPAGATPCGAGASPPVQVRWVAHDAASFVVHTLPAPAFEALLVVMSWHGEVIDDDPPYRLDVLLDDPFACWCRLDLVPDAGGSTVAITLGQLDHVPAPSVDEVRDLVVAAINQLGDLPD